MLFVEPGRVVPLVENGYLVGVVDPTAIRARHKPAEWPRLRLSDFIQRRMSLVAVRPEDDLQPVIQTLAARLNSYAVVINRWGQFDGQIYLRDIPLFLEWQLARQELNQAVRTAMPEKLQPEQEQELAGVGGDNKDGAR